MSAAQPRRATRQDCILVVEDDASMWDIVCQVLKADGYTVVFRQSAEHLEQGLAQQTAVDGVLLDLVQPSAGAGTAPLAQAEVASGGSRFSLPVRRHVPVGGSDPAWGL
jgi:CheY-like chemotaxis protein